MEVLEEDYLIYTLVFYLTITPIKYKNVKKQFSTMKSLDVQNNGIKSGIFYWSRRNYVFCHFCILLRQSLNINKSVWIKKTSPSLQASTLMSSCLICDVFSKNHTENTCLLTRYISHRHFCPVTNIHLCRFRSRVLDACCINERGDLPQRRNVCEIFNE